MRAEDRIKLIKERLEHVETCFLDSLFYRKELVL